MQWLHFVTLGGSRWGYKIVNEINESENKEYYNVTCDLIGHIHFRLNVINELVILSNEQFAELHKQSKNFEKSNLFSEKVDGIALHVDNSIRYRVSSSIHSIFYEINTCCELLEKLEGSIISVLNDLGIYNIPSRGIRKLIVNHSSDNGMWVRDLDRFRNYYTHEGTVRLAILVKDMKIKDLLIYKHNNFDSKKEQEFITLKEIGNIVKMFWESTKLIDEYLATLIE